MSHLLELSGVERHFGGLKVLHGVNLAIPQGGVFGLIGPNGAGKTTVFNLITGLQQPDGGTIRFDGRDLSGLKPHQITRLGLARTFQNIRLFPKMTVLENLIVAQHNMLQAASVFSLAGLLGLPSYRRAETAALEKALNWLERLGLLALADTPAGELPYGTQRRIEIARALCVNPVLLCLDEPAAGLNPRESAELNQLLLQLSREEGVSVLLIEHDMSVVMKVSDHIVVLNYGCKIAEGQPLEIQNNPQVIKAYLGEDDSEEVAA